MTSRSDPTRPPRAPVPMLCMYRVKRGQERAFLKLLSRHWPALRAAGLASRARPRVARSVDRQGRTVFVERFSWAHAGASDLAHRSPVVMAVWGPMGPLLDGMEFLDLSEVTLPGRRAAET